MTITAYAIKGKAQNNLLAFSFPTTITKVFLPFDLSASWSGKDAINKTKEDKVPITIPARIDSILISPDWIKKVPIQSLNR